MKRIFISFLLLIYFSSLLFSACDEADSTDENQFCRELLIRHLSENFDDIHDVSMRFHHLDPELNGLISLGLAWEEGRLRSFSVIDNETGSSEFATALGSAMEMWHIAGMPDNCRFNFSLMIKIVGRDDPAFLEKAIFTGEVIDSEQRPVRDARISFLGHPGGEKTVPDARTNREGIFVRTLIPPGTWSVKVSCPGYRDMNLKNMEFNTGEHKREEVVMERIP